MSRPLRLAILGSTGSIGRQALDVAARYPERVEVVALAAHSAADTVVEQALRFGVSHVALTDPDAARAAEERLHAAGVTGASVDANPDALVALAEHPDADVVLNALVGAAGLRATVATLRAGKVLALANKESLVIGGELVTALAAPGSIRPVDSEHSAIFQCLTGEDTRSVARLWLTASGGPFRGATRSRLATVTAAEALAHPTWSMGPKITIDSATLMNKGLEVIEAHYLFGTAFDHISVVIHPQSCIHSMVEYSDGSVIAHLGATDMRISIQYALSYPERWDAPLPPVDFTKLGSLDFAAPDMATFGCLSIAFEAGRAGGTAPAVLNAANEVAVAAFLAGRCGFLDIEDTVRRTLDVHEVERLESLDHVEAIDRAARMTAEEILTRR